MLCQFELNSNEMEIEYCDSTEGVTQCKTCQKFYCNEHISQCEKCKNWYCDSHFGKCKCKCNDEEEDEKKIVAAKKLKTGNNDNYSHGVALRKSGGIDINTINKIDTVLEIHHIDVGQGDSTLILIKSFKGVLYKSILIDSGLVSEYALKYFDQLDAEKNFRPIDIFIVTHPDKDHVGGAPDILKDPKYTNPEAILYDNGKPFGKYDSEYDKYLECAKEKNLIRKRPPLGKPIEGGIIFNEHSVILRCLACNGVMSNTYWPKESPYYFCERQESLSKGEYSPEGEQQMKEINYPGDKNNLSIALYLQFGNFSYFTAGDLSGNWEEEVAYHINLNYGPVSAWKASHHGAQECTTEKVVGYLQGRVCVLSFGEMNNFGHPFQAPIDHLEALNKAEVPCTYYCTGQIVHRDPPSKQYGKLGVNGRVNQGTIIIRAYESQVKKNEIFHVETSKSNSNDSYQLNPDRDIEGLQLPASEHKGKAANPLTQNKKAEKAEKKKQREKDNLSKAHEALKEKILGILGKKETDWPSLYQEEFKVEFDKKAKHLAKAKGNQPNYSDDPLGSIKRAANDIIKTLKTRPS